MVQNASRHGPGPGRQEDAVSGYLRVLSSDVRREVLQLLRDTKQPVHIADVADDLNGGRDMYIQLHHIHAPLLDDMGIADYNPDERTIVVTGVEELPLNLVASVEASCSSQS